MTLTTMSFTTKLRLENAPSFDAALTHPFVTGIGDGTLPRQFFARWIAQDWLYLHGYVQALHTAAQLADTQQARHFWHELATYTRDQELDLHRSLAQRFDLTPTQLDATIPYAATTNYLNTLKQACTTYPTLVATVTPCAVGVPTSRLASATAILSDGFSTSVLASGRIIVSDIGRAFGDGAACALREHDLPAQMAPGDAGASRAIVL